MREILRNLQVLKKNLVLATDQEWLYKADSTTLELLQDLEILENKLLK